MLSSFFTLSHSFSQQLCGEGNPVPIWQPEKQRPGRWACQEERFQPHRPTPEQEFSVTLLPASWIYKSLKFHCFFHLIKITKTHVWFRSMTSLLNFFSQTQFLKWRKNKVYSPRTWFEVQDGESRASILCGASFLWIIHCTNTRHQKGLGLTAQAPLHPRWIALSFCYLESQGERAKQVVQYCSLLATGMNYPRDGGLQDFPMGTPRNISREPVSRFSDFIRYLFLKLVSLRTMSVFIIILSLLESIPLTFHKS